MNATEVNNTKLNSCDKEMIVQLHSILRLSDRTGVSDFLATIWGESKRTINRVVFTEPHSVVQEPAMDMLEQLCLSPVAYTTVIKRMTISSNIMSN